ncbi:hypothetical protein [Limosilactobacillus sp.]|jgi:hypothetical protein|uniref:hypothetical protein n=1 Tax=Limosilactobacillus sp. TaxID=2773925 RepID=UPI0025C6B7B2|nr:hypothetical protein [Limosilactobacillus sp.]MCH3922399.1 hypothetical protein [Limosilactobacillus sp.]MCH3929171.1 hypothetical protein [Limosilactobacillus sp.]
MQTNTYNAIVHYYPSDNPPDYWGFLYLQSAISKGTSVNIIFEFPFEITGISYVEGEDSNGHDQVLPNSDIKISGSRITWNGLTTQDWDNIYIDVYGPNTGSTTPTMTKCLVTITTGTTKVSLNDQFSDIAGAYTCLADAYRTYFKTTNKYSIDDMIAALSGSSSGGQTGGYTGTDLDSKMKTLADKSRSYFNTTGSLSIKDMIHLFEKKLNS